MNHDRATASRRTARRAPIMDSTTQFRPPALTGPVGEGVSTAASRGLQQRPPSPHAHPVGHGWSRIAQEGSDCGPVASFVSRVDSASRPVTPNPAGVGRPVESEGALVGSGRSPFVTGAADFVACAVGSETCPATPSPAGVGHPAASGLVADLRSIAGAGFTLVAASGAVQGATLEVPSGGMWEAYATSRR